MTTPAAGSRRLQRWLTTGEAAFFLAVVGVYLLFRAGSFNDIAVRVTDTPTYEAVSSASLFSAEFWAGGRAFTVPLVWKAVSDDGNRILVHLVLSIAGWLFLAAAVAGCLRMLFAKRLGFVLVLLFATTTEIVLWDTLLLSESISLSLTATLLGTWLLFVRRPSWLGVAGVLAVTLLWTFARDSHAYVALVVAFVLLLFLTRTEHRRKVAALAAGGVLVFALSSVSANEGARWYQPMRDILLNRIAPDPAQTAYFEAQLGPGWRDADARAVYVRYLATHPGYTFGDPLFGSQTTPFSSEDSATSLLDPDFRIYNDNASHRPLPLPKLLDDVAFVHGKVTVLLLMLLIAVAASVVALRLGMARTALVAVVVLVSTLPHALVAYHLSGLEVDRHALEVAVLLRLGALLLGLFTLDAVLEARRSRATA